MITESIIQTFMLIGSLVDALIPDVNWPDWLFAPASWLEDLSHYGFQGGATLTGAFAFVHPDVYRMLVLQFGIVGAIYVVRKVWRLLSLALGGGGAVPDA